MTKLDEARSMINDIDQEMLVLFEKRMMAVQEVLSYKIEHNLPIFDAQREQIVLERNLALVENEQLRTYYETYLKTMMDLSKQYQTELLKNRK